MSIRILLVLATILLGACQSKEIVVSEQSSPGGLDYTLIQMPKQSRVSIQVAWPSNWARDEEFNPAIAHIGTQLLLAGGAQGYPAGEVIERFGDMRTEGWLELGTEHILGTLHYSPEHQDESLKTANAHLRNPLLDQKWFDRVRDELLANLKESRGNAQRQAFVAMRWAVFRSQPIREARTLDDDSLVKSVTQAEVVEWAKTAFNRNGMLITIAGDLSAEGAGAAIDALFDGLPEGESLSKIETVADFSPKRILLHTPDTQKSSLSFVGELPAFETIGEFEDDLLVDLLGSGFQSVLFETVRAELRASYNYGAHNAQSGDKRILLLTGEVETDKIAEAEKLIKAAYEKFRKNPAIDNLKERKKKYEELNDEIMKDTGSLSRVALAAKMLKVDPASAITLEAMLESVTKETMTRRVADAFPTVDELIVVVSSPDEEALPDACVVKTAREALEC